jgi:hypothetical protein
MIRVPTIFDFDQGNRKLDAGWGAAPGVHPAKARPSAPSLGALTALGGGQKSESAGNKALGGEPEFNYAEVPRFNHIEGRNSCVARKQ